jgi:hypothetical protein
MTMAMLSDINIGQLSFIFLTFSIVIIIVAMGETMSLWNWTTTRPVVHHQMIHE